MTTAYVYEVGDFTIYRYKTLKDLMHIGYIDEKVVGFGTDGVRYEYTADEFIDAVKSDGIWAFNRDQKEIHIWFDGRKAKFRDIITTIGHEVAHGIKPVYRDERQDEIKAGKYEEVVKLSYGITSKLFDK